MHGSARSAVLWTRRPSAAAALLTWLAVLRALAHAPLGDSDANSQHRSEGIYTPMLLRPQHVCLMPVTSVVP